MSSKNEGGGCSLALAAGTAICLLAASVRAETIVDEWASVQAPPAPALKSVTVDRKTTALLMLDFNQQTCNMQRRPRCVASIPKVKPLLEAARAAGVPVVYSVGGGGKPADIPADLAPRGGEPVVSSGVDKFVNTDLEKILKDRGVTTVIVVGAAAHGAVLYTASTAAMRGMKVVLPLDGISADLPYAEQYVAWHFANVPVIAAAMTLTSIDRVKF
ncbi:MAG TPA: isochorismatase family protein [Casimicrobiaceae bacterium]|jgi:nicotinamidase-related amidase|nr:isochorismatase family protein [Casimicrobiaceae bacterium]